MFGIATLAISYYPSCIIKAMSVYCVATVREFKNNRNKMLPSFDLYFLKEDEICEFNLKNMKSYPGIFSQKLTLKFKGSTYF